MKFWTLRAFILLLTISTMPALSQRLDKQKTLSSSKLFIPVHKSMFEPLETSFDHSNDHSNSSVHRQPHFQPQNEQPQIVSEYSSRGQAPNIVEFGASAGPVAAQPPTVRPSGMSNHVQEFSSLPGISPGAERNERILKQNAYLAPAYPERFSVQKSQLRNRSKISARTFNEESLWPPVN